MSFALAIKFRLVLDICMLTFKLEKKAVDLVIFHLSEVFFLGSICVNSLPQDWIDNKFPLALGILFIIGYLVRLIYKGPYIIQKKTCNMFVLSAIQNVPDHYLNCLSMSLLGYFELY